MPRMPNAAFSQIVNRSMSEVLTRSLATSFSTLLPVLALLLFGGETLKDFAFALLIGIASGTYSSVFIAGPVLTHWKEREPIYRARTARIMAELGHVPAFAVATAGAPIDVAPKERRRRPVAADPAQGVGQEEFEEMVANLGVESRPVVAPPRQSPSGGRRARSRANGGTGAPPATPPREGGSAPGASAAGDDVERPKPKPGGDARKERRKHGRAR
jgi:SecD/SecF fusion protein